MNQPINHLRLEMNLIYDTPIAINSSISQSNNPATLEHKVKTQQQRIIDNVLMNPIEKYVKYNIHPYPFFIQLALIIFVSLSVIIFDNKYSKHEKNQLLLFQNLIFQQPDFNVKRFYSLQQFQNHLLFLRDIFYKKDEIYFQNVDFSQSQSYFLVSYQQGSQIYQLDFKNNQTHPFQIENTTQIKHQLMQIQYFQLQINDIWILLKQKGLVYKVKWDLLIQYDISEQGHITGQLDYIRNIDKTDNTTDHDTTILPIHDSNIYQKMFQGKRNFYLQIIIFVLASISLYSNLQVIFNMIDMYMQLRILKIFGNHNRTDIFGEEEELNHHQIIKCNKTKIELLLEQNKSWYNFTFKEKMLFFDYWLILNMITNLFQIWNSIVCFLQQSQLFSNKQMMYQNTIIGLTVVFTFLNMLKYFNYYKITGTFSQLFYKTTPYIIRFFVAFCPILFGYQFLGLCLFYKYEQFSSFRNSLNSLFALMVGDSLFMMIDTTKQEGYLSQFYFFSYIFLSYNVIHSVIVAIICDHFQKQEQKAHKNKLDQQQNQLLDSQQSQNQSQTNSAFMKQRSQLYSSRCQNSKQITEIEQQQKIYKYNSILQESDGIVRPFLEKNSVDYQEQRQKIYIRIRGLCKQLNQELDLLSYLVYDKFENYCLQSYQKQGFINRYREFLRYCGIRLKNILKKNRKLKVDKFE